MWIMGAQQRTNRNLFQKSIDLVKRAGVKGGFKRAWYLIYWKMERAFYSPIKTQYYKINKKQKLKFKNKKYEYFYNAYNETCSNERAIEVPLVYDIVNKYHNKKILEVGNVFSHYFKIDHQVVDKYEHGINVLNEDILNFKPKTKFDLIFSISTIEHIGYDEEGPKEKMKSLRALQKLYRLLNKNGLLVITVPINYNLDIDEIISKKLFKFNHIYFFRKVSIDNRWVEVRHREASKVKYNYPFKGDNAIALCFRYKSSYNYNDL